MVKTGQFTTKCKDDSHSSTTAKITLVALPYRSRAKNHTCCECDCSTINGHSSNTSREQNRQLPYDFAGKGVLNVLDGVLPK